MLLMQQQNFCAGTCKSLHSGFPEDDALSLDHVGILYVMYDF
jgi:hypothetical protein